MKTVIRISAVLVGSTHNYADPGGKAKERTKKQDSKQKDQKAADARSKANIVAPKKKAPWSHRSHRQLGSRASTQSSRMASVSPSNGLDLDPPGSRALCLTSLKWQDAADTR